MTHIARADAPDGAGGFGLGVRLGGVGLDGAVPGLVPVTLAHSLWGAGLKRLSLSVAVVVGLTLRSRCSCCSASRKCRLLDLANEAAAAGAASPEYAPHAWKRTERKACNCGRLRTSGPRRGSAARPPLETSLPCPSCVGSRRRSIRRPRSAPGARAGRGVCRWVRRPGTYRSRWRAGGLGCSGDILGDGFGACRHRTHPGDPGRDIHIRDEPRGCWRRRSREAVEKMRRVVRLLGGHVYVFVLRDAPVGIDSHLRNGDRLTRL